MISNSIMTEKWPFSDESRMKIENEIWNEAIETAWKVCRDYMIKSEQAANDSWNSSIVSSHLVGKDVAEKLGKLIFDLKTPIANPVAERIFIPSELGRVIELNGKKWRSVASSATGTTFVSVSSDDLPKQTDDIDELAERVWKKTIDKALELLEAEREDKRQTDAMLRGESGTINLNITAPDREALVADISSYAEKRIQEHVDGIKVAVDKADDSPLSSRYDFYIAVIHEDGSYGDDNSDAQKAAGLRARVKIVTTPGGCVIRDYSGNLTLDVAEFIDRHNASFPPITRDSSRPDLTEDELKKIEDSLRYTLAGPVPRALPRLISEVRRLREEQRQPLRGKIIFIDRFQRVFILPEKSIIPYFNEFRVVSGEVVKNAKAIASGIYQEIVDYIAPTMPDTAYHGMTSNDTAKTEADPLLSNPGTEVAVRVKEIMNEVREQLHKKVKVDTFKGMGLDSFTDAERSDIIRLLLLRDFPRDAKGWCAFCGAHFDKRLKSWIFGDGSEAKQLRRPREKAHDTANSDAPKADATVATFITKEGGKIEAHRAIRGNKDNYSFPGNGLHVEFRKIADGIYYEIEEPSPDRKEIEDKAVFVLIKKEGKVVNITSLTNDDPSKSLFFAKDGNCFWSDDDGDDTQNLMRLGFFRNKTFRRIKKRLFFEQ
jgi:hypothetical protein